MAAVFAPILSAIKWGLNWPYPHKIIRTFKKFMSVGRWWILTIPEEDGSFTEDTYQVPLQVQYVKGQLEEGVETGYRHWQVIVCMKRNSRVSAVKAVFGRTCHAELTRSAAAEQYVWKEDTRVQGTQFQLGQKPVNPAKKTDWDEVWKNAKEGNLTAIPAHVLVR